MPTIADIRKKYPQYDDMSDAELAGALHRKFYSDMSREEFNTKIGLKASGGEDEGGFLRTVDNAVRGAADMLTFGTADEIAAGLGALTGIGGEAGDYSGNLEDQRQRDEEGGAARFAGQMAGALMIPGAAARTTLGAAGQGALMGAGYGFGSGEGGFEERTKNAAAGAFVGGAAGGAVRGVTNALSKKAARKAIPSNDQLKQASQSAYDTAEQAGLIFRPRTVQNLALKVKSDLAQFGYHPQLQQRIAPVLQEIGRLSQGNITLKGMEVLRRIAKAAANSSDASEKAIARQIVERIDETVANAKPGDVIVGDLKKGIDALNDARSLWAMKSKGEVIEEIMEKARNQATGFENGIRIHFRSLANNKHRMAMFTPEEQAAIKKIVRGGPVENTLKAIGWFSPTGTLGAVTTGMTGVGVSAPAGIGLAGAGYLARKGAEKATGANVRKMEEMVRSGGKNATQLALEAAQGRGDQKTVEFIQKLLRRDQALRPSVALMAASGMDRVRN